MINAMDIPEKELTREQAIKILMYELEKGEKSDKWYTMEEVFGKYDFWGKDDENNNK